MTGSWCLVMVLVGSCAAAMVSEEVNQLLDLYGSTSGEGWFDSTNWGTGDPCESHWAGVTCTEDKKHLLHVYVHSRGCWRAECGVEVSFANVLLHCSDLGSNNLNGTLPPSFGHFSRIDTIRMDNNGWLEGSIPDAIGLSSSLRIWYRTQYSIILQLPSPRLAGSERPGLTHSKQGHGTYIHLRGAPFRGRPDPPGTYII
mmetsp:Transcript_11866/g.33450  ORF Transcript_11866/g.33450 Transcript_11866/m.33450 type:complete len:200 (+) Transcript_11866:254-853(+)